jgi:hypothetical protein
MYIVEELSSLMLSPTQQTTLHALMDRIIPPDDYPGAWEAGVGDYMARLLKLNPNHTLDLYCAGLDALEAEAQASAGASLAALPPEQQDALLKRVEAGQVRHAWTIDPIHFFQTAVQHVSEGFYSDPGNGGNRDAVGWQMIGYLPGGADGARA